MAIKYTREGVQQGPTGRSVWHQAPPGRGPEANRKRILFIYVGIAAASLGLLGYYFNTGGRINRWLPVRTGDAVVVEKEIRERTDGVNRYIIDVEVLVPPAQPSEAALLEGLGLDAELDEILGAQRLPGSIAVPEEYWNSVDEGTGLRVEYQINLRRNRVMIRAVDMRVLDEP